MADMQITVRFRREARNDGLVFTAGKILFDNVTNKIGGRRYSGMTHVTVTPCGFDLYYFSAAAISTTA
jgi:hypothetical protein